MINYKKPAVILGWLVALLVLPTIPVLVAGGVGWLARRWWQRKQQPL